VTRKEWLLANPLRLWRKQHRRSRRWVSGACLCSHRAVCRWEQDGVRPQPEFVEAVRNLLGWTREEFWEKWEAWLALKPGTGV
jgi:Helix-turn-helix domain